MSDNQDLISPHDRSSLLMFIENEESKLNSSPTRIKKLRSLYDLKPLPQTIEEVKPEDNIQKSQFSTFQENHDITNDVMAIDTNEYIVVLKKKPNLFKRIYSLCKEFSINKRNQRYEEYEEYLFNDEDFEECYYYIDNKNSSNMWYNSLFK